jgi:ribosomal-protein-alanine N-acetyltransferase
MEPEDISTILEIDREISGKSRAVTYASLITGDLGGELDLSFVAEVGGKVAGFILARHAYIGEPVIEAGLIQILGVQPNYQRQGIARGLVNAMLERCRSKSLKMVRAMVNERDSRLQGFFAHMGFGHGQLIDYSKTL